MRQKSNRIARFYAQSSFFIRQYQNDDISNDQHKSLQEKSFCFTINESSPHKNWIETLIRSPLQLNPQRQREL
jgi:hypothetical protein